MNVNSPPSSSSSASGSGSSAGQSSSSSSFGNNYLNSKQQGPNNSQQQQQQQQQQMEMNRYPSTTASLIWPIVIRPLLCKIQKHNQTAAVTLLKALGKAEHREPGFLLELITAILASHKITVNMTEALLRLQANIPEFEEQRCRRPEEPFQELNRKTFALKKILSRIPDVLYDRQVFLETIRKIASAIKKLLDCVNEIISGGYLAGFQDKRSVENRKREFIKDSKNFSQTLKEYFKKGDERAVLQSAAQLIFATNAIQKTIKTCCDVRGLEHNNNNNNNNK